VPQHEVMAEEPFGEEETADVPVASAQGRSSFESRTRGDRDYAMSRTG
jgi:hypothetical protein